MPHLHKHLITAVALATLGLAVGAQTAAPAVTPESTASAQRHGDPARMQERMAKRQAALKQKLQITPAQEGAWNTWTTALTPNTAIKRPARGELERLTTPERIDRMKAFRTERIAEMDRRADATKAFYATLSPEQKKVFDAETAHGHRGRHHVRG